MMPRQWATPLVIGAFILMSVTGVLMFFHMDRGLNAGAHEYVSWLFMIGVGGHVVANIRSFRNHLQSGWGRGSVALFAVLLAGSFLTWGMRTGGQLLASIQEGLVRTPLSTLAVVARTAPQVLEERFKARGMPIAMHQSIRDVAGDSPRQQLHALELVFLP